MRIIHTSDLHINSPLNTHLTPAKTRERRDELLLSFRNLTNEAMALGAEAVIIAGDLFDSERVSSKALDSVLSSIERAGGITFLYLSGNHEKNALTNTQIPLPKNLKIFDEEWTYYQIGEVKIAGRSRTSADMFSTLSLGEKDPSIVVLHGELRDFSDTGGVIGVKDAAKIKCDYMALGHYHEYSERKINDRCVAVYSGTPEGRGFDETGERGYVVIDIDKYGVRYSFKKRALRTLYTFEVDISEAGSQYDIENLIEHKIKRATRDDLVQVVLVGKHPTDLERDIAMLESFFEGKYYYFEIKDESRLKINMHDYENDKSLKGEFIRMVLSDVSLTEKEKTDIIECGLRALNGEKIKR